MRRAIFNFILALEGVNANRLRSFLTALGIIFGVAAVIAMLAIGAGAKQSILDQMRLIGVNNIVVKAVTPSGEENEEQNAGGARGQRNKRPYSPGLTLEDVEAIAQTVPGVELTSPEIIISTNIIREGRLERGRCIGATNAFFTLNNLSIGAGNAFHQLHLEHGRPVCVIGKNVQTKFFGQQDPIGKTIKCGNTWLTVIGVLLKREANKESLQRLGIRDYNDDIFVPVSAALLRFQDRGRIGQQDLDRRGGGREESRKAENYHQIDRVVLRMSDSRKLQASVELMALVLKRRHLGLVDFEIEAPELLLEQEQKTQDTFNWVLAAIAAISLLVGGIGIMNIMLASVMERIKEIGIRRSLGATRGDIIWQFLFEAVGIGLSGGLIGIGLGVAAANIIAAYADIPTIVSAWSIFLSFGVAATVGLVFGIFPARRAARQDPIKALRAD